MDELDVSAEFAKPPEDIVRQNPEQEMAEHGRVASYSDLEREIQIADKKRFQLTNNELILKGLNLFQFM